MRSVFRISLLILVLSTFFLSAKAQDTIKKVDGSGKIFTIVEEMPSFPGGEDAMLSFVAKNIHYPTAARGNNIVEKVYVNFYVDTAGNVVNAKVLRGIGGGCDEEALRVVKSMPKWKPGNKTEGL